MPPPEESRRFLQELAETERKIGGRTRKHRQLQKAIHLKKQGYSYRKIAKELGVSLRSICYWISSL